MSERKTFVLDTSVLLSSPRALFAFKEHHAVLPLIVIKELEAKRNDPELGLPARQTLRFIEDLSVSKGKNLKEGVVVNEDGGTLRIEINHIDQSGLPDALRNDRTHDTRILAVASSLAREGKDVTVVSKDMPMRILAETLGLNAEEYKAEQVVVKESYSGITTYTGVPDAHIDNLYRDKVGTHDDDKALANDGVILKAAGSNKSALAVVSGPGEVRLVDPKQEAFGVRPRSAEQRIALDHLLNPEIGIVSLGGPAGTGKTLLALAAGLEAVLERREQKRIIVFRPLYSVGGQDLGFLPGTEEEKMDPWAAAIMDALRAFNDDTLIKEVKERKLIEVLPLTHIRGRTLTDAWIIIDEAQNLERPVLLTALSRLGENSKVALSWDVAQRDNLRVGRHDGIHAVVERLKGNPLFAHTSLVKSERSKIAAMVTALLDDDDQ